MFGTLYDIYGFIKSLPELISVLRRRWKFTLILLSAGMACGCVFIFVSMVGRDREREKVIETYGETLAKLCSPMPEGIADRANLPIDPDPLKALVLIDGDSRRHNWHNALSDEVRADRGDEVQVVMCVSETPEWELHERCPYYATENLRGEIVFTIDRNIAIVRIVMLNAATHQRIVELTLRGEEPAACPAEHKDEGTTAEWNGAALTSDDFLAEVERYLRP